MAFNRTDTRQRAYNKIDACQPHGNWVDERSYNKTSKGCLMGNWFEESILRDSLGKEPTVHKVVVGESMPCALFASMPRATTHMTVVRISPHTLAAHRNRAWEGGLPVYILPGEP
eukprot:TRINITY_DN39929_c0_g1_i1.p1 TRINITY_DN39929_c0_g1~~TRINITY_DN39929_c0_g1_i1.p1  ORF type:complete len:115 (+),score=15.99 TRINITY_DN39929_c0_g1_i1:149-493(+)